MDVSDVLLGTIDTALILQGPQGEVVYANRSALELFGKTFEELLGSTSFEADWDAVSPDGSTFPTEDLPVATAMRTKEPVRDSVLGIMHAVSGERAWLSVDAIPRMDGQGAIRHIAISLHRVTVERHRVSILEQATATAQRALADHEQLYSTVVGVMGEGVIVRDAHGNIQTANPAAARLLGVSLAQLLASDRSDHDGSEGPVSAPLPIGEIPSEITGKTGKPVRNMLLGWLRADGRQVWFRANTDPLRSSPDEPMRGVVVTFADVTKEREAELALNSSRAELKRVTEAMPGVLFRFLRRRSGADEFLFLSARTRELFGVDVEAALEDAESLLERIHPPDREALLAAMTPGLREPWEGEVQARGADGNWRWLRGRALPEAEAGGTLWSGVLIDVTHERHLRQKLGHAQRREAMGDVASGVAHNFNNMLAAVILNIESAQGTSGTEAGTHLDDALQAAHAGAELVRELMQMTRRDAMDRVERVDVVRMTRRVVNVCRPAFEQRITIRTRFSIKRGIVDARRSELSQVLLNICLNARDAMEGVDDATLTLDVTERIDDASRWIVVRIADVGAGMSDATKARLGEPFFTTKAPGKGTGLGLATAYATLRSIGGTIDCESAIGRGTTFEIRLPQATSPPSSSPEVVALDEIQFESGRVLLIDDERMIRRAVARDLARRGLEVTEAADGVKGLEMLETQPFDLVVLDLSMPNMTGDKVLAKIRAIRSAPPVIVVTGHLPDDCDLTGAATVLLKPVSSAGLARAIDEAWTSQP